MGKYAQKRVERLCLLLGYPTSYITVPLADLIFSIGAITRHVLTLDSVVRCQLNGRFCLMVRRRPLTPETRVRFLHRLPI